MSNHCCLFVYWYQSKVRGILGTLGNWLLCGRPVQILVSTMSFSVFGSQSETEEHYHTIHFYFFIFLLFFWELVSGLTEKNRNVNIMIIELLSICTLMDQTRAIYVVLGVAYIQTSTLKSHKMKSVRILRLIWSF